MKVYSLKSCDTCRKAIKEIQAAGLSPNIIDVRADRMSPDEIASIVDAVGFEKALNRRSTTWRGLDDVSKADLDDAKAVTLIGAHPTLLKRPAITDGNQTTVGWDAAAKATWL
ncbi:arsenate reductase [Algimonas ampicilliniresistens]|uniref:Arsenate reductase n=1 Tax=Algimonas ampicilliniresistens TaxID=1298735 RepID=A0ABQ5V7I0_9PROT|nr:ArsC/Spx/MgsR family protein [Algimonas ampicilliniresistens]GLQ22222.1 arsenate reductase [Algimonas ampicilliniresistens]